MGSPEDISNLLSIEMAALEQEQLRVVLLDTKHRILGTRTVYQGSVNQVRVRMARLHSDQSPWAVNRKTSHLGDDRTGFALPTDDGRER